MSLQALSGGFFLNRSAGTEPDRNPLHCFSSPAQILNQILDYILDPWWCRCLGQRWCNQIHFRFSNDSSGSAVRGSDFYPRGFVKQALHISRCGELAFSALQPAMRSSAGPYRGFRVAPTGWAKRLNRLRIMGFSLSLNVAFSLFDARLASRVELTLGLRAMPGLLWRRGELLFAGNGLLAPRRAVRASLTPVVRDPGRFRGPDPCSFVFRAMIGFILVLVTGLFSVDTQRAKKVRTAR